MKRTNPYSAFNARWLTPQEVARTFIQGPQLSQLLNTTNCLLLGPRGCGKTTLLKMITREAIQTWNAERASRTGKSIDFPDFEAVYIPSDMRWSSELRHIGTSIKLSSTIRENIQRVLLNLSLIKELSARFYTLLDADKKSQVNCCEQLIKLWHLTDTAPAFSDVCLAITTMSAVIRGTVNLGADAIEALLTSVNPVYFSHTVDVAELCCEVFSDSAPAEVNPTRWALCYDELEIAPEWLQKELLEALRSTEQQFILKLTWSPILPLNLRSKPEAKEDYEIIRLWFSHTVDAHDFCEDLASSALQDRLNNKSITPSQLLGRSVFSSEERFGGVSSTYERGSYLYSAMRDLSKNDESFKILLIQNGLDPDDPYTDQIDLRDRFLRKIKPVVLLRDTFWRSQRRRSRKRPTLYSGKEAVFAMSEGNPRRLLGLLNELLDYGLTDTDALNEVPLVPYSKQAQILRNASSRFIMRMRSIASDNKEYYGARPLTVSDFLDQLGGYFGALLLADEFPLEAYGSFTVDEEIDSSLEDVLDVALREGAIFYVGASQHDVATRIRGSRFRLTFLLAPEYRLLMRNNKPVPLSRCLSNQTNESQLGLFPGEMKTGVVDED